MSFPVVVPAGRTATSVSPFLSRLVKTLPKVLTRHTEHLRSGLDLAGAQSLTLPALDGTAGSPAPGLHAGASVRLLGPGRERSLPPASPTSPRPTPSVGKPVPGARNVGDHCSRGDGRISSLESRDLGSSSSLAPCGLCCLNPFLVQFSVLSSVSPCNCDASQVHSVSEDLNKMVSVSCFPPWGKVHGPPPRFPRAPVFVFTSGFQLRLYWRQCERHTQKCSQMSPEGDGTPTHHPLARTTFFLSLLVLQSHPS